MLIVIHHNGGSENEAKAASLTDAIQRYLTRLGFEVMKEANLPSEVADIREVIRKNPSVAIMIVENQPSSETTDG